VLQLSLLTPYMQELVISARLIWHCSPLSGLLVQPLVRHLSDRIALAASPLGRRRLFISAGAASIVVAVFTVGLSADLGRIFSNPREGVPRSHLYLPRRPLARHTAAAAPRAAGEGRHGGEARRGEGGVAAPRCTPQAAAPLVAGEGQRGGEARWGEGWWRERGRNGGERGGGISREEEWKTNGKRR